MVSTEDIVKKILNFSENEFFAGDPDLLSSRGSDLLDMDYMCIAINGPQVVLCDKQEIAPIVMAMRVSGDRGWDVNISRNCYIVATNLINGNILIAKALVGPKDQKSSMGKESSVKGPKPPGLSIASAQVTSIDARKQVPITWNTGLWSFCVIYYDWLSNTLDMQLIGDEPVPLAIPANQINPDPDLADIKALPSYVPTSKTPKTPDTGVAFTVEYNEDTQKKYLNVYGAFSLIARDFHLAEPGIAHLFQDGTQHHVAAIIPMTFIMVTLDASGPAQFNWNVPVYGAKLNIGDQINGVFAIEVLASENLAEVEPGEYVCYIAMDGRVYGPQTLIVPETGK